MTSEKGRVHIEHTERVEGTRARKGREKEEERERVKTQQRPNQKALVLHAKYRLHAKKKKKNTLRTHPRTSPHIVLHQHMQLVALTDKDNQHTPRPTNALHANKYPKQPVARRERRERLPKTSSRQRNRTRAVYEPRQRSPARPSAPHCWYIAASKSTRRHAKLPESPTHLSPRAGPCRQAPPPTPPPCAPQTSRSSRPWSRCGSSGSWLAGRKTQQTKRQERAAPKTAVTAVAIRGEMKNVHTSREAYESMSPAGGHCHYIGTVCSPVALVRPKRTYSTTTISLCHHHRCW